MPHKICIQNVVKRYGDFTAVKDISVDINPGEFFTLLGPSGCGKTTLLRMIAGFNTIEGGSISFGDQVINDIPAHKRDIGMVFQNYAIFPHMSVFDNVAYGLKARKFDKEKIAAMVEQALELVQIAKLKNRKPAELSGGQQQRVALARAIVIEPGLLLMDEPLSNLDAKLRVQMRTAIKKIQRKLNITTIYVTHDQEEALSISDRIAVMKDGVLMQVGTPKEIYSHPANPFVAGFIGISNFLPASIENGICTSLGLSKSLRAPVSFSGDAVLSIRPEHLFFSKSAGIPGEVKLSTFLGDFISYEVMLDSGLVIQVNEYTKETDEIIPEGQKVLCDFDISQVSLYRKDNEEVVKDAVASSNQKR